MARRSPVEVDARRYALRALLVDRKYRRDQTAGELLASTADDLAREAAYEINAGRLKAHKRGASTIIKAEDAKAFLDNLPAYEPRNAA